MSPPNIFVVRATCLAMQHWKAKNIVFIAWSGAKPAEQRNTVNGKPCRPAGRGLRINSLSFDEEIVARPQRSLTLVVMLFVSVY
jgi:hypothetical protein